MPGTIARISINGMRNDFDLCCNQIGVVALAVEAYEVFNLGKVDKKRRTT